MGVDRGAAADEVPAGVLNPCERHASLGVDQRPVEHHTGARGRNSVSAEFHLDEVARRGAQKHRLLQPEVAEVRFAAPEPTTHLHIEAELAATGPAAGLEVVNLDGVVIKSTFVSGSPGAAPGAAAVAAKVEASPVVGAGGRLADPRLQISRERWAGQHDRSGRGE